ncbi:MAG: TylF/MycF/NovP-related O-methyltransferase [Sneathiellaceae bacterium]
MERRGIRHRLRQALGGSRLKAAEMRVAELEWEISKLRPFEDQPSYRGDMMATWYKSVDFLEDPRFMSAYARGMDSGHSLGRPAGSSMDIHIEWRIHTCCWAAAHAVNLPGDFAECGVNTGIMSLAVCEYVDFNSTDKTFWLFDTYRGVPPEQLTDEERADGREKVPSRYFECYELAKANFAPYPRARLVRGTVPDTFSGLEIEKVAYLSLDMNIVEPERAALAYFWPRLVPGAVVVMDDYGWKQFAVQKQAHDAFARSQGTEILLLPTGQGLLIKP